MTTITVTVLREGGRVSGHPVTLDVMHGAILGPEYTDPEGMAEFQVEDGDEGTVYVDGYNEGLWGSNTGTDITVYL
jgi:hypothetical protein